ncbi:MAG: hypothetical protein AB7O80_17145 [Acetobacteraceae bacterium]
MIRPLLTILALTLVAGACTPLPQPLAVQPAMTRSQTCQVNSESTWGRPSSTPQAWMQMNNDGNWCWMESQEYVFGEPVGPFLRVTTQPTYGQVQIATTKSQTRVAYRPNPGFVGNDRFRTVDETLNIVVDYNVMVTK